jgi:hypothetical protein
MRFELGPGARMVIGGLLGMWLLWGAFAMGRRQGYDTGMANGLDQRSLGMEQMNVRLFAQMRRNAAHEEQLAAADELDGRRIGLPAVPPP